jgi:hypothetical protein
MSGMVERGTTALAQGGEVPRRGRSGCGAVLVEAHVQRLVQAVLDPPVRPHNRGEPLGIELG